MSPKPKPDERRFIAALAIYQSMTTHMFALRDAGKLNSGLSGVVPFAIKYSVEQADRLLAELDKRSS